MVTSRNTTRLLQYHALPPPLTLRQTCKGKSEQDAAQECSNESKPEAKLPDDAGSDAQKASSGVAGREEIHIGGDGAEERKADSEEKGDDANCHLILGAENHGNGDGTGALQSKDDDQEASGSEKCGEENGDHTTAERESVVDDGEESRSEVSGDDTPAERERVDDNDDREESGSEDSSDDTPAGESVVDDREVQARITATTQ